MGSYLNNQPMTNGYPAPVAPSRKVILPYSGPNGPQSVPTSCPIQGTNLQGLYPGWYYDVPPTALSGPLPPYGYPLPGQATESPYDAVVPQPEIEPVFPEEIEEPEVTPDYGGLTVTDDAENGNNLLTEDNGVFEEDVLT